MPKTTHGIARAALFAAVAVCLCLSASPSIAGVRIVHGPTPIPGGDARSAGDITVLNEKLAFTLAVGSPVPDFSLPATRIGNASRASLKGKPFVIYFYPKDNTSGCTAEACDFRDNMAAFNKLGVTVIGISKDSLKSHENFAKKFGLTFPLASDEDGKVCDRFGVWIFRCRLRAARRSDARDENPTLS